jgi:hypothetical protein
MSPELRFVSLLAACLAAGNPVFAAEDPVAQARFSFLAESNHQITASSPDLTSVPAPVPGFSLLAEPGTSAPVAAYSPLHGVYGSLIGIGVGGLVGILVAAPMVNDCKDGESDRDEESGSLCGLFGVFGMGIGAGIGYSLGVPVGGHFSQGLLTRKFAINMAAAALLTGVLAYTDWQAYDAYNQASFKFTIPLSVAAPHLASYLIGR